jgi:Flp pilus assembly protein CpaB
MKRGATAAVITLLFAAAAAAGVFLFMKNVRQDAQKPQTTVDVLVSAQDIPAGTELDTLIAQNDFVTQTVPANLVIQGVITDVYQLQGQRTAYPILAGEQISAARLAGPLQAAGGTLGIPSGYQAASITLEAQRNVAGALKQGDHVEVWGTFATKEASTTRVVIPDALVLAVPTDTSGNPGNNVTLAVTPVEASLLIYTQGQSSVWLTLLPPNETGAQVPPVTERSLR